MGDYKTIISIIAVLLVLIGYFSYIRDIFKTKTTPHLFTWFIWSLAVSVSAALQILGGAGVGAWTTIVTALVCCFILFLSFKYGDKNYSKSDILFLALALISLALWVFVKQPVWSVVLIVATDILGFVPTVRKSWDKPYSETLSTYQITGLRHALSIVALEKLNILTLLYPVAWTLANILFSIMLIIRRKMIKSGDLL
ncbi:MAG: conserved rane protein of unknown function [Candidatus Taylorbacteria bacterium]|nr:conserved rane protein of unknown function [Candidatus Taylorbacteria bacterium]